MKSWPLTYAFLFILSGCLSAQSLPAGFSGKWFDAENPLSTIEIVSGASKVVLASDSLDIREIHLQGDHYEVVVSNARHQKLRLSFKKMGDERLQFALLPNTPRTFTRSPSSQRTDQAFALDLKIGATYYLDVRATETIHDPENERKWGINQLRELIERCWYEYRVVSQPTEDTYLLEMKVKRVLRITRFQSGFVSYKDSRYQLPDDQTGTSLAESWAQKQRFRVTINKKGQILDHRKQSPSGEWVKPKVSSTSMIFTRRYDAMNMPLLENISDRPAFLWSVLAPHLYKNSFTDEFPGSVSGDRNRYEYSLGLFDFFSGRPNNYAEKRGRITRYGFPDQSILALDDRNGWIKYGRIASETADRSLEITLSGWSEQYRRAVISGKIINAPVPIGEMERYVKRDLEFSHALPVDFQIDKDGNFRLSCDPGKVLYSPEYQFAPLYLRPGDSLHLIRDYTRDLYPLDFSGDAAVEQAVAVRQYRKLGQRNIGQKRSAGRPAKFKYSGQNTYQSDSLYLDQIKSLVDPVFYQKAQWDLRYLAANTLLAYWKSRYHHILRPSRETPPDLLQPLGTLPVNNDMAVGLAEYRHFLQYAYLDCKTGKVRNFFRGGSSLKSLGEEYALAKYIYTGEPLFEALSLVLKSQLSNDISPTSSYPFLEEFWKYNPDSTVNRQFEQAYAQLMELEPGSHLPEFTLQNSNGKRKNSTEFMADKTLFIPFDQAAFYLTRINFDSLQQWYPDLQLILLSILPPDEAQNLPPYHKNIDPDLIYFIPDQEERRKVHSHLHLYPIDFPQPSFRRAYLVDGQGKIFDNFRITNRSSGNTFIELKDKIDRFMSYQPPSSLNPQAFFLIIGSLGLGGCLVWLFKTWQNQQEKRRRKMIELEIRSLRAQLNPHFIFNTMSSIQNLIASERPELANEYLADLAALLRKVLRHTQRGTVSLAEELDLIRQYCALEYLRKPFELTIYNEVGHAVNDIELPALILQPYVENAILHGLASVNGEAKIDIIVESIGPDILIRIVDNGIGLHAAALKHSNGNNIGLKTNAERLKLLFGGRAKVQLTDRQSRNWEDQGTIVELQIPQI